MKAASLKTIQFLRWCMLVLIGLVAFVEHLMDLLFVGRLYYTYLNIWFILPALVLITAELLLQPNKKLPDYLTAALTIAAVVHTALAMAFQWNHEHDDALLCWTCGSETLKWYTLPWLVLMAYRLHGTPKARDMVYWVAAVAVIVLTCLLRGSIFKPFFAGATYAFFFCGGAWMAVNFVREAKNTIAK